MPGRQPPDVFQDQGAKLVYLIVERGDRRPRSTSNPDLVQGEQVLRRGALYQPPIVVSQATLAGAMAIDPARVNDWFAQRRRVPPRELAEICRIFAVDERAFRTLAIDDFIAACKAADRRDLLSADTGPVWRALLRARMTPGLRFLHADPHGDPFAPTAEPDLRYARAQAARDTPPLPEVACGTPFWLALASPQASDGSWTWSGWSLLLLSHDRRQDGFACLLSPRHGQAAFGTDRFPDNRRSLYLPAGPGLRHEAPDEGEFGMIALLSREPPPVTVANDLAVADAHGPEIEPALNALAAWSAALPSDGITIIGLTYRVVAAAPDAERKAAVSKRVPAPGQPGR